MPTIYRRARATKTDERWQDALLDPGGIWRLWKAVGKRPETSGRLSTCGLWPTASRTGSDFTPRPFPTPRRKLSRSRVAAARGLTVKEAEDIANLNRVPVKVAVETYLEQKASKAHKTKLQYKRTLYEFLEALKASRLKLLDEVNEGVLRKYKAFV